MRLPDPFTPNLKVDLLPEISLAPRIMANYHVELLEAAGIQEDLDSYLQDRAPYSLLLNIKPRLTSTSGHQVQLINALVLYVGTQVRWLGAWALGALPCTHSGTLLRAVPAWLQQIAYMHAHPELGTAPLSNSAHTDVLMHLAQELDSEGRYHFVNAMVNHLRFPNSHTHFFSCMLLILFQDSKSDLVRGRRRPGEAGHERLAPDPRHPHGRQVQESVTRVLIERLIVHRPHPWGLLITFIELIKNPRYTFWSTTLLRRSRSSSTVCRGRACSRRPPPRSAPTTRRRRAWARQATPSPRPRTGNDRAPL